MFGLSISYLLYSVYMLCFNMLANLCFWIFFPSDICSSSSFFLVFRAPAWYSTVQFWCNLFIQSPVDGYLSCLQLFAFTDRVAMGILVYPSLGKCGRACRVPISEHLLPTLDIARLLNSCQPEGCKVVSQGCFNLHFPVNESGDSFHMLLTILWVSC